MCTGDLYVNILCCGSLVQVVFLQCHVFYMKSGEGIDGMDNREGREGVRKW